MNANDNRRFDRLVRIRAFRVEHAEIFAGAADSARQLEDLDGAIVALSRHFAAQASGGRAAREGTSARVQARQALRRTAEAISRFAALLGTTGLDEKFRLPQGGSDQ